MSAISKRANIRHAEHHSGSLQRGKDFDVVFAWNEEENPEFPGWVEDFDGFLFYIMDFIDNWEYSGVQFPDSSLTLITKSGQVINSDHYYDYKDFIQAVKPFTENHFAAAIFNDIGEEYFWVNGWSGYLVLQEYTGWFDMDIYTDWI